MDAPVHIILTVNDSKPKMIDGRVEALKIKIDQLPAAGGDASQR